MEDTSMFSINRWHDRWFKIISIMGFFLILVILTILLNVGPATSYEFSIYDAYPGYFWVFLLSAIFIGQVVIFGSAINQSGKNYWYFGLGIILVSNAILLFMPIIRGYYFSEDGDVLSHIGYMKDILLTSGIGGDRYPMDHILGVIIHEFSGLTLSEITLIVPPLFSFFFILSIYFVGKTIFQTKFELLILVLLSSILMFGNGLFAFIPNAQAFSLVPLILYLAFRMYQGADAKKYNILLLLICFLIVFYHPLITIMVILILCLMQLLQYILEKFEKRIIKKVNYTYTIFFMLAVFSLWSSYLREAVNVAEPMIDRILGQAAVESELQKKVDLVSQANVDPIYLVKLVFASYGQFIILGILSLLCLGLILKSMNNQNTKSNFYKGIPLMGFLMFLLFSILIFLSINQFGFKRILNFAILFSLLMIPTGICLFFYTDPKNKSFSGKTALKLLGVMIIFFCITFFSTFNLYYSPIIKQANQQVPKSDYVGMSTFFSYRDDSLSVLELGPTSFRFYDAIYGRSAKRMNIFYFDQGEKMIPPDHLGSQNETVLRDFFTNSKYLILNDRGRDFYPNMYPEFKEKWRFLTTDFEQLKNNEKIQRVYSNRNMEIYLYSVPGVASYTV
jgi:hypothetical protein